MRYCVHQSMPLLLLAGFPECCTPKSPPPLSCSSELASCTFSTPLPLVCFFLLLLSSSSFFCFRTLLSSEPEDVFSLLSQKLDWLACATRRLLYVFRVVRVVWVVRRVVRVVQVVWRVLALYWRYTTGLLYRKFYTPRFIWTFLPD